MAGAGASPTITRLAGVLGAGPVRSVATATSSGIAPSGFRVYVSDDAEGVIRLVDLARGQTSVVGGDGSNGRNLADGSLATSGAINPGARTVAPDGSVAHSQGRSHGPELYRDTRDGDPYPSAVAVGPNGQVVFDFGCQIQIRMIVTPTTSAVPATTVPVAGNGTCGDSGDGGPAVSAELESNPPPWPSITPETCSSPTTKTTRSGR